MSTITTIQGTDTVSSSRSDINTNFSNLNTDKIENLVDDASPQLGADLDLNGNNIDFPSTANISDCLDEDNMASNSATALATQQSIKAYVDAQSGGFTQEEIEDFVGAMFTGNTETLISATYQDGDGTIDLVVDEASIDHDALTNFVANEHIDWTGDAGASNIHVNNITAVPESAVTAHEGALTITESQISDLSHTSEEQVEDWVGGMVTGNTETGITVTYQDGDGTLDFTTDVTLTGSETLTNKTINGDNNTISNLDIGNEVDWAAAANVSDRTAFASGDKLLIFEDGVGLRKIDYDDLPSGGGGGDVSKVGTPANNQIGVWTGDGTIEGDSDLTFDGSDLTCTGVVTGATVEATGDTSAGDNAAIGYTSTEGVILTGQGSSNDVTIKNDADIAVVAVPTGTQNVVLTESLYLKENGAANSDATGQGQIWVKSDTPNRLMFTDDAGNDVLVAANDSDIRYAEVTCFDYGADTATGDGKGYLHIPAGFDGMNLVEVHAEVITAGTTGTTDIQLHNVDNSLDMLSTKLTIDSGETGSDTAATAAVINASNDHVNENDMIRIDVDAISTTAAQGLIVTMGFQLP